MKLFNEEWFSDEHVTRFLLLTLLVLVVITGFSILPLVLFAMAIALAIQVLRAAVAGLRYGYAEGKLGANWRK
ncbi:hypothetical protein [Halegenticoccus tardaugens]|uniref:hypothetical protein n=1 Tax=Halegenticoccus tardaugens TaxID=2071624 RepID=UPI00100A70F7|nr:hypothetical protein [Halegenticoccus tardaugens]